MTSKTQDPHDRLLAKAFGDLARRPFAWCFDEDREPTETPAAPQEPREGVTYYMRGDDFLAMLRRHIGMPEE